MIKFFLLVFVFVFSFEVKSLDIEETIKNTINKNDKIKLALEKINESKEILIYSKREKLPKISSSISGTYSTADTSTKTTSTTPETLTDEYKISISQNLYDSGYNDLEIERSKILYNNELINFKLTIQDLILKAIEGYLTVINFEKSLEATKKNYDSVLKVYEETKTRFDLGSATLYDLQNAEASFAIATTNLYEAELNLSLSKQSFTRIVGKKPTNLVDLITIDETIDLNKITNEAFNNNLNLILINNEIKDKEINILKEKSTKKPSIDIVGTGLYSYGSRLERGTNTSSGSVSLTLTIPLYQKGQDDSNIRKFRSQMLQAEIELKDSKEDLKILLANTYKDFKINQSKMESNIIIIRSIETSLQSLKEEYQIGTKSITDLIDEEEKLLKANVDFLNYKRDFLLNYFKIKSLDGSLIDLFKEYLPTIN